MTAYDAIAALMPVLLAVNIGLVIGYRTAKKESEQ